MKWAEETSSRDIDVIRERFLCFRVASKYEFRRYVHRIDILVITSGIMYENNISKTQKAKSDSGLLLAALMLLFLTSYGVRAP